MAQTILSTIKNWFKTGARPTQAQFWAVFDSFWHKDESIPQSKIQSLQGDLNAKADRDHIEGHINDPSAHSNIFNLKVDKAGDKMLTTHDFDDNYKAKVDGSIQNIEKGAPNGIAALDEIGKIRSEQLPSYVDDVLEGKLVGDDIFLDEEENEYDAEKGKIYLDIISGKSYRWSGSQYLSIFEIDPTDFVKKTGEISQTIQGELITEGYSETANWQGRIIAGGISAKFLMGQFNHQAWLGAHNGSLNGWKPLYINPEGSAASVFIGAYQNRGNTVLSVISQSGRVGILTNSPEYPLHVKGSAFIEGDENLPNAPSKVGFYLGKSGGNDGSRRLEIVSDPGRFGYIDFTIPNVDREGRIIYDHTNHNFSWQVKGNTKMVLDINGCLTANKLKGDGSGLSNLRYENIINIPKTIPLFEVVHDTGTNTGDVTVNCYGNTFYNDMTPSTLKQYNPINVVAGATATIRVLTTDMTEAEYNSMISGEGHLKRFSYDYWENNVVMILGLRGRSDGTVVWEISKEEY